ncbi:MAG: helix-turn-helix transcriptional regulator [Ruminococcus sp.]|nr:helix-turn-helix transcriptional regulator [Ruminococcus sp.]
MLLKLNLKLRELREENSMSQAEMAKLLGCSQQTYSRYETHTTEIPLEQLIFLADYYDTSVDFLLGITNHNEPYPKNNVF